MTAARDEVPAPRGRHLGRVHGRALLEQITHELVVLDHLKARIDKDRTARAVVAYVEAAVADLDDARTLLEQHLRGL